MNQILNFFDDSNIQTNGKSSRKKYIYFLRIQLCLSIIFILLCIFYWVYTYYTNFQKEQYSKQLTDNFSIRLLYTPKDSPSQEITNSQFVIGIIRIDKISIHYPILYNTTDELLKIAPCRFYGPLPNQVGNLCIAAHNYDDNRFFGRIHELVFGDSIYIYDLYGNLSTYIVYDKYEVNLEDISCLNQNTNGACEITLVTCNNFNNNRIIIKAKQLI